MSKRMMHLVAYLKTGPTAVHGGGWRHPEARLDDILEPERYEHIARELEAACFDACFFADLLGLYDIHKGSLDSYVKYGGQISYLDPMTVLPIMARATSRLGLGATLSTTFFNAYHLARALGSLDVLSKGRVAWNIVTSATDLEAQNFGFEQILPREVRYDHADEVLEACLALWNSWDADAFVQNKQQGVYADPSKVHYANYKGRWVSTRGPLSIPRSPQGHPVLMQAGSSERGRRFAARWAELIFTAHGSLAAMQAFYTDIKGRLAHEGREPEDCKILVQTTVVVAETDAIAREKAEYLNTLAHQELTLAMSSSNVGADLSKLTGDATLADLQGNQGIQGSVDFLKVKAQASGMDFKTTAQQALPDQIVGTAQGVADQLQALFEARACDGFVVSPIYHPGSHEAFCRSVVPELQRRGLFRTQYSGHTLRDNLKD
ncbi:LLM class flavin-dependent oxidoreductase [Pseudomonas typographi]|uniref:LLM class flavin-dependent oxidoreductase n=1 Tax=Pseudomonas typographi TaxID=2715964 RepID=UPI00168759DC|nr:LLM class flavin-dependent oxidoreductase [Pseudomonas typographi]MBD1553528.1 LLM class flavin-dependent oxidoreductase [Pseudomonas typographi]MBD1588935.1 LLM class flavin-dependent oxidoreductase [Pseudomonas typographi]